MLASTAVVVLRSSKAWDRGMHHTSVWCFAPLDAVAKDAQLLKIRVKNSFEGGMTRGIRRKTERSFLRLDTEIA